MKNPLNKRIPRELKQDLGKYIALFLFITLTIGLISGFLVADDSLRKSYDESFNRYNVEDGHFILEKKADAALIKKVEKKNVKVENLFYKNKKWKDNKTVRVYQIRKKVNRQDLLSGSLPGKKNEIALDRLFAKNNGLKTGDTIRIGGKDLKITGLVALTDYSALFQKNADLMFDSTRFGVGVMTRSGFDAIGENGLNYCYAWISKDKNLSMKEKKAEGEKIQNVLKRNAVLTEMILRDENQAIKFTGSDMGGDRSMMLVLLYVIIVVLGFVFAVTARSTLRRESSAIGTLRASGYSRGEMIRHYLVLPTLITLLAAIVGNVLGYTVMRDVMAALYLNSYSLTAYHTLWNGTAFFQTTVIPCIMAMVIDFLVLAWTFRIRPLDFLHHEISGKKGKHRAVRLPNFRFVTRFRIRIILQNLSGYLVLFIGILLATLLLLFGILLNPMLEHYSREVDDSLIAKYQYILKAPANTDTEDVEKYAVTSLDKSSTEEITIYGISKNSAYLPELKLPKEKNSVLVNDGFLKKYRLNVGDNVTLEKKYSDKKYTFRIAGSWHYVGSLAFFMSRENYNKVFKEEKGYYNGYFSDKKIKDIPSANTVSIITEKDLNAVSKQLKISMGEMFSVIVVFAVILYILLMYLLARLVIEKNASSIAMIRILGCSSRKAGRLYNSATALVVVISVLISAPLAGKIIRGLYWEMMRTYHGWMDLYYAPWEWPMIIVCGLGSYFVVSVLLGRRVRKIPLSQALKDMD